MSYIFIYIFIKIFAGRCYDAATLYYRLDKGQILTMENVAYAVDREKVKESGFFVKGNGYIELDQFIGHCFSDPSICADGMSFSFYVKVTYANETASTLARYNLLHFVFGSDKIFVLLISILFWLFFTERKIM